MNRRRFGVNLLSTPEYYLFGEEEARKVYYNLCEYLKYKYKNTDYDYSILVGLSKVDGKSVLSKVKSNGIGRHRNIFVPKNEKKGIKYVNWHFHIMVCGAPLGSITNEIANYMQKVLNIKLINEEFDKRVYSTYNFNKYYFYHKPYQNELEMLLSGLLRKRNNKKEQVPKCSLCNLNVNRRKTKNTKEDYFNILKYIDKQSILTNLIESKDFKIAYFDYAKELNLLAKPVNRIKLNYNKSKGLK